MEYYEKKSVSPTKKILNICSYVLNAILIIYLIVSLSKAPSVDRNSAEFKEKVAAVIIEKESTELPLRAQEFGADKISIDSLVFTGDESGYLVCKVEETDKYGIYSYGEEPKPSIKTIYVEVENIKANKRGVRWYTNWQKAFLTSLLK
jgi:hypothetical protein